MSWTVSAIQAWQSSRMWATSTKSIRRTNRPSAVGSQYGHWLATYGQALTYSGPQYLGLEIDGDHVRLRFAHAQGLRRHAPVLQRRRSVGGGDPPAVLVWPWT
jgi:hypothetical protein